MRLNVVERVQPCRADSLARMMTEAQLRAEYESSLSWRLTRPLRAAGRVLPRRGQQRGESDRCLDPWLSPERLDSWLEEFHGPVLDALDQALAMNHDPQRFALFGGLAVDLWALLLTKQYELYPRIRSLLPDVPQPAIQELWNGTSGVALAAQSAAFYRKLCERYWNHGPVPLPRAGILDYGCGWGRLTRFLARDVAPGNLYGCDPVAGMVDHCRQSRLPAIVEQIDVMPSAAPFERQFDLAFAFSVFTHLSEEAHELALSVLHEALRPHGILVATIRPPSYVVLAPPLQALVEQLGTDARNAWAQPRFLHVPHPADELHPQYTGGPMHYGETVITPAYIREYWSDRFELLDVDLLVEDLHQVVLTLRRR
jgi:SAM-dependent methyltransferase